MDLRYLLASLSISLLILVVNASKAEYELYRYLLSNYSSLVRPVPYNSQKLRVSMRVFLQQIIGMDEKNQVIELNAWLRYVWSDYRLKWNPDKFDGIQSIRLNSDDHSIFKPDILLYNSADKSFDSTFKSNMVVYSTGEVNWIPPGIFRASCKIDITWFPFDEQSCFLKFGSWTYNGFALDLQLDKEHGEEPSIDLSTYIPSGEWLLTSAPAVREETYYKCCPEPYPTVKFFLNLRRRTLFYTFNLIIPSLLVAIMTLLAFCLPAHDMSEKIGTQTTILLSVCFFLTIVSEMTPPTSEAVPLLGVFFSTLTLIVAISTAFTIAVMNLRYRQPTNHHMRPWFRKVFLVWLPWLLLMKRPGYMLVKVRAVKCIGVEEVDQDNNKGLNTVVIDYAERSTISRMGSMPSPSLSLDRKVGQGIFTRRRSLLVKKKKSDLYDRYIQRCTESIHERGDSNQNVLAILEYYKCMQTGLKFINERMQRQKTRDDAVDEYRFASMVLDRFCLIVFTIFIAISITVLFSSAPYLYA
ncbi:hypothetical protein QR680_008513 [Steinernema hermaphroditum]|uniref:Uncharacterized protein n=1 Tax=Steinernema hermaphroditum TaxID=289476 RepID=A0AA39M868_9BILA|nr:hypothetical protein QR680_008513 [Steinernema hermaphroditum]